MARTQVQSELIATNAISGTIIADNAITATHIATNSISGTLVQDGGIVTTMIANNNVTATKIVTDAIQTRHIANDQVTGDKLTDNITIAGTLTSTGAFTSPGIDDNADATAITIDSSENIGIGMGADGSYGRIVVNSSGTQVALRASSGTARLGFFEAGAGRFYLQTLDGADGLKFIDGDGSTEHMRITAAGNVGIGTDSPGNILHVHQSDASSNSYVHITQADGGSANTDGLSVGIEDGGVNAVIRNRENGYLRMYTNNTERVRIASDGKVGIGNANPQHPFIVHLTNGQIAMFGSNGMNSAGQYAGIGLGQVLADNTTYQKIQIVAEGRDSGSYVSNLHFLVDINADSGSAVLADSKMMLSGENGFLGVGLTNPKSRAEFHLDQVAAATNVTTTASVHFGSQQHTDGAMMGITLGYREASMNYRKVGIFAEGRGDNAARQNLLLCVDTVSDGGSVRDTDAKIQIDGINGETKIGSHESQTELYALKVQTTHGYGRCGANNGSYFHHETDTSYFYWNEAGYFNGGAHSYSDEKLKKDIVVIPDALDSVAKMNGVTFKWKDPENRGGKATGEGKQFGVIAQNMLEVDPELPTLSVDPLAESGNEDTDDKLYSMDYARLSPYFIEAIKELKTKLEAAEAKIAALESK